MSDGTLRYLFWVAALLTPRSPALLVFNEPETSLHPELLPALAELVVTAAASTQIIAVTHSPSLVTTLQHAAAKRARELQVIELTKDLGQTRMVGQDGFAELPWRWPKR